MSGEGNLGDSRTDFGLFANGLKGFESEEFCVSDEGREGLR